MIAGSGFPDRDWFARHPLDVAPQLLGALLTSRVGGTPVTVRVTEVEAYGGVGEDPGSHAHRRRTARNAAMFGRVGHAYVYFTYGMHWCLNVVAHLPDEAGAVLIRAGEVLAGVDLARERRPAARVDRDLARGPARLARALGVTGDMDGVDLLDSAGPLQLAQPCALSGSNGSALPDPARADRPGSAEPFALLTSGQPSAAELISGPRVGIAGEGAHTPWRFWLAGEPTVSPHRRGRRST